MNDVVIEDINQYYETMAASANRLENLMWIVVFGIAIIVGYLIAYILISRLRG